MKQTAWNPCLSTSSSHHLLSSSILLSSVLLLPTPPLPSSLSQPPSCAFILSHPWSKRSWPYMKRGDFRGLYPLFPRRGAYKDTELTDWRNRSGNLSISPHLYHFLSLSPSCSWSLFLATLLSPFLSVFCLVTYSEMLNLPPRFELIIKSEWVQGPAPSNEEKKKCLFR